MNIYHEAVTLAPHQPRWVLLSLVYHKLFPLYPSCILYLPQVSSGLNVYFNSHHFEMKLHHPNAFLGDRDLFKLNLADRSVQYFVWYPEHWVSSSVLLLFVYLSPLNNAFLTPLSILMGLSQPSNQQQPHHRSLIFFPIVFYSNCSLHHPAALLH